MDTVGAAVRAGADAITAINTLRAMAIDIHSKKPILSNKIGGLSGTPIKPVAVRCVYEIASRYDIPVIGCGGISTWEDAVEFILAGASAVQLGSAVGDRWLGSLRGHQLAAYLGIHGGERLYRSIREMIGIAKGS